MHQRHQRTRLGLFVSGVSLALVLLVVACSTETTPGQAPAASGTDGAAASTLTDEYRRLGDNLGQTIAQLKTSARTDAVARPAQFADVAPVLKEHTGGFDILATQSGNQGERTTDIDALGEKETVAIFVPDPPDAGTSATQPSFVAWKGDAESGDEGLCYLAWTKGVSWFVASRCGDDSGAWVCRVTSDETTCSACTIETGECTPCDMAQADFTCAW